MGECSHCGTTDALTRNCNHCGKEVCSNCTLPEKHNCAAVDFFGKNSKHLQNDLDARRDPDNESSDSDTFECSDCGESYEYFADAQHCCQESPEPVDNPRTHGGSGRDREKADFSSSPDVNPDGSINDEDLNAELDRIRESATTEQGLFDGFSQKLGRLWLKIKLGTPRLRTLVLVLAIGMLTAGQLGFAPVPGFPVDTSPAESLVDDAMSPAANGTHETTRASGGSTNGGSSGFFDQDLNRTRVEYLIHKGINERRQEHGLQPIAFDTDLRTIARYHSRDMGEEQYFSHTSPDGESMEDRYEKYDYSCRVSTGGNQYATGAENIAYTYFDEDVVRDNGEVVHYSNEEELAQGLINQWMNSTGHRKNILKEYWKNEGIGIYVVEVDDKTRVYATQNFC
ncbi:MULTISPECIES: CAP domain-containing protein [Halorussus]|uniref:CAP domain-containing protein n=1 Tax=Halorussus TaxID=1070314 RepID=UPI000E21A417|nr:MULTISPECIES: CAP domain-containing protein [Halorussus]NHN59807.1 hypothetical protein [Halorussus sp. JP-T4]